MKISTIIETGVRPFFEMHLVTVKKLTDHQLTAFLHEFTFYSKNTHWTSATQYKLKSLNIKGFLQR